ncbi:GerAB/ArcD/ProY family transporter [Peribacillus frigoritolerans]|uniref:GerAB/ArcD/ProY family transporter n=1 Tax=Peribacillus frigoritolerans TaxID=450367 RepID=UPI0039A21613
MVKENRQVSPFFAFYLIHSMQIGVGILGFEHYLVKSSGQDSWIAIIIPGLSTSIIIWMSYQILNNGNGDITIIHKELFGKWIGNILSLGFVIYLLAFMVTITRTYVEVIQVWMFPQLNTWYMVMILLALTYSFVTRGFRVVTGVAFFSVIFGLPLVLLKWFPLQEGSLTHLLPVMNHSVGEIFSGAKTMTLNYLGFETLFFFYPFIKTAKKSQKWAQTGHSFSILIYLITGIVSLLYFSQSQLKETIWATLTLWKIIDLPFIERFEYAGISIWLFVVLPNLCIIMWSTSWGVKQVTRIKQRHGLVLLLGITFIVCIMFSSRTQIDLLNTYTGVAGTIMVYLYIPFLYVFQLIQSKVRGKK